MCVNDALCFVDINKMVERSNGASLDIYQQTVCAEMSADAYPQQIAGERSAKWHLQMRTQASTFLCL